MKIRLEDLGKRYGLDWIFRHISFEFEPGLAYAVTGYNGSGKSTLLKIISGGHSPSQGRILYERGDSRVLKGSDVAADIAYTAPYIHLVEEFTLREMVDFHFRFKKMRVKNAAELIEISGLGEHSNKIIANFSSGMMQRLKLSLSILSDTSVLLLDEPTSYLDVNACDWYHRLMREHTSGRLVIIGSNQPDEYTFARGATLHIPDFKPLKR